MLSLIEKLLSGLSFFKAPASTITNRLVNRYTGAGILLVVSELIKLHILPVDSLKLVEGLKTSQISIYISLAVSAWLILHVPYKKIFKSRLEKIQEDINFNKLKLENQEVLNQLKNNKS